MENYLKTVSVRRKERFFIECGKCENLIEVVKTCKILLSEIVSDRKEKGLSTTLETATDIFNNLKATGIFQYALVHSDSIQEHTINYLKFKYNRYVNGDRGALGDGIEAICHLVACREVWRTKKSVIHVSAVGRVDVTINGIGYEVGHNGKTWTESEYANIGKGTYAGIIYGCVSDEEMKKIILLTMKDFNNGIKALCNRLFVWQDKSDFFQYMENLGAGQAFQYRESIGNYVSVYNPSRLKMFRKAVKMDKITSLSEYMRGLGKNDYLSE